MEERRRDGGAGAYEAEVKEKSDTAFLYECDLMRIFTALNFETIDKIVYETYYNE